MIKTVKFALVASAVAFAGSALAATDGALDATSVGTTDVTIVKQDAVELTKMDDIDFGVVGVMAADTTVTDEVCVFSTTGDYTVVAVSSNAANPFEMGGTGAETTTVPYAMTWDGADLDVAGPTGVTGAGDSASRTCATSGGTNATIAVTVAKLAFDAADVGSYTDTVTLTVSPL